MVPNPFLAKVIVKVVSTIAKSAVKAYANTLKKNNAASGKKAFKFDWNDIFKHHKLNMLNYFDVSKFKTFKPFEKFSNPFEKAQDKVADSTSKSNTHKISQVEALKILAIDAEAKLSLKLIMEQYLFLYTKNRPEAGGSAYIQAKVMNAKDMLVEQFGGVEAEMKWRLNNGYQDDDNTVFVKKAPEADNEEEEKKKTKVSTAEVSGQNSEEESKTSKAGENEEEEEEEGELDDEKKKTNSAAREDETEVPSGGRGGKHENIEAELRKYCEDHPQWEQQHIQEEPVDKELEELMQKVADLKEKLKKKK